MGDKHCVRLQDCVHKQGNKRLALQGHYILLMPHYNECLLKWTSAESGECTTVTIPMQCERAMKKQGWGYARLDSGGGPLREDHLDGAESFEQKVLTNAGAGWA